MSRHRRAVIAVTAALGCLSLGLVNTPAPSAAAAYSYWPAPAAYSPPAALSSSGDFATDMYGDPWDFNNAEDFSTAPDVQLAPSGPGGVSYSATNRDGTPGGWLRLSTVDTSLVRFAFDWPGVLPWGRDTRKMSIDTSKYSVVSFRMCNRGARFIGALRWANSDNVHGAISFWVETGCADYVKDLNDRSIYNNPDEAGVWSGTGTEMMFFRSGGVGAEELEFDYFSIHRPGAPNDPTGGPAPRISFPSEAGQDDFATTVQGNAWDMNDAADIAGLGNVSGSVSGGQFNGVNTGPVINDPHVKFPVNIPIDASRFHRATIDICYDGGFSLNDIAGGGMVGRFFWSTDVNPTTMSETQDIVVFPGCQTITIDLRTDPASAINDENTAFKIGWACRTITEFWFDPDEDRGARGFHIRDVKLADDPHFSDTTPIQFTDASTGTADIRVSTIRGDYNGTIVASGIPYSGATTWNWNGRSASGALMPAGSYWVTVTTHANNKVATALSSAPLRFDPPGAAGLGSYIGITPYRVLDTRVGPLPVSGCHAPTHGNQSLQVQIAGVPGLPSSGVTAVAMNVTAVNPTNPTFLTAYPSGSGRPNASNLNAAPGQTIPNMVIAKVGGDGEVAVFNYAGDTDIIADVVGYFTNGSGDRLVPIVPERALDTRTGTGGFTAPLGPNGTLDLGFANLQRVPAQGVTAVAVNVTAINPTVPTYLTVYPSGGGRPNASNVNAGPGDVLPNLVMAKLGPNGKISIFNLNGNTNVAVDVVGYFTTSTGSRLTPIVPERALDTRNGIGGATARIAGGTSIDVDLTHLSQVPGQGVKAVAINVTGILPTTGTYLTVWPSGDARPDASSVNAVPGQTIPNLVIAKVGANGKISIYNNGGTIDALVDVVGYFT